MTFAIRLWSCIWCGFGERKYLGDICTINGHVDWLASVQNFKFLSLDIHVFRPLIPQFWQIFDRKYFSLKLNPLSQTASESFNLNWAKSAFCSFRNRLIVERGHSIPSHEKQYVLWWSCLLSESISERKWVRFNKESTPTMLDLPVQRVRVCLKIVSARLKIDHIR